MPICVQYIFNMSLGTTVAMSVATAAFLDYVWGTACTYLADAGLRDENLILLDLSTLTIGDNVLKFTSLALLSGKHLRSKERFWPEWLSGYHYCSRNITTLILSPKRTQATGVRRAERLPCGSPWSAALDNLIVDDGATCIAWHIIRIHHRLGLDQDDKKLERGCLLCDVAEYGPSMMRLVVSLLETYLFSWAMKWLLTTVCHRRLSSRRGTGIY